LFYYIRIKIKQYYFFLEIKKYIPVVIERKINPPIKFDDGYEGMSSSEISDFIRGLFVINNDIFLSFADLIH
jgi:hypothetical protein